MQPRLSGRESCSMSTTLSNACIMVAPLQLRALLFAINALLRKHRYHTALAMLKGFQNGAVYGAKIQAPHSAGHDLSFPEWQPPGEAACHPCRPRTPTPGTWPGLCSSTRDSAPCSPMSRVRPTRHTHSCLPSSGACWCLETTVTSTARSACTCYPMSYLPFAAWAWRRASSLNTGWTRFHGSQGWCGGWCCGSSSATGQSCSPRCNRP